MQIKNIAGINARCEAKGVERDVSLILLQDMDLTTGDYVLIHVGYAIQKITESHARSAWQLYDEMLAVQAEPDNA